MNILFLTNIFKKNTPNKLASILCKLIATNLIQQLQSNCIIKITLLLLNNSCKHPNTKTFNAVLLEEANKQSIKLAAIAYY